MNAKESEHKHQAMLFRWASLNEYRYPQLRLMHAIPNGGLRAKSVACQLKAEGVRAGVPDIFLPVARHGLHGLYIEMKKISVKPKRDGAGGVSREQRYFMDLAASEGYLAIVCYGWEEAVKAIENYLK